MVMLIAMVIAAIVGFAASGEGGALAGALFGWLIVRSLRQQRELDALRKRAELSVPAAATSALGPVVVTSVADLAPEPFVPAATLARVAEPATSFALDEPAIVTSVASVAPIADDGVDVAPPRDPFAPIRRWLFGGNTIVKAGVGILFIGLAFLAKYASEHAHLPVEVRLAGIGAAAVVLLAFGWRLRTSRPDYAQVLQGGAVAVLYLTLFAAFRFYGVLPPLPAFVLMVAVAGLAAALAVLQDARSLAIVGALGGFATPLIVSTGSNNHVALFAYYFVLDAGIAAVAWSKTWRPLNLVGFVATFVVATAWGVLKYEPENFATSQGFLIAFFLLFVVILVLPARRRAEATPMPRSDLWVNSSLLFGLPTITFALEYGLVRGTPFGAALAALILAGVYVGLASWMKNRPELGITFEASLAIATVFLTLVIPFALDERSTAGAWTLEGAGLVWIGFRQRRIWPRAFGYGLLVIAGAAMLLGHERHGAPTAILNAYLFNGLMAAAASLAAALFIHRARVAGTVRDGETACEPVLIGLATLWLVTTAALEIDTFVAARFVLAAILAAGSVIAVLYAAFAARFDWPTIAWPAAAHAPFLILFGLLEASLLMNPMIDGGWWAWPLAFVAHGVVLRWASPRWPGLVAHAVHAIGAITLALVGALLGRAVTARWGDAASAWPWLGWLLVPAALMLALPRPATARLWPVRLKPEAYRDSAGAAIAAGLWLWTLVANIASDGSAAPLPHVPFLNPLDVGIGIALVATLLWLRSIGRVAPWSLGLAAAAGFVWLNAVVVRGFHHYAGVPYQFDAWVGSLAVQTGITLLWTAIALVTMWLAAAKAQRMPWVAGAALLGAVVLKLLLVDLSGSGSVTRIVSFIGVGVLMLVIGYVAPLPAREVQHANA
ncbi:MAG: DUF2339 domain-containing protein [Caldimonas sp.]